MIKVNVNMSRHKEITQNLTCPTNEQKKNGKVTERSVSSCRKLSRLDKTLIELHNATGDNNYNLFANLMHSQCNWKK